MQIAGLALTAFLFAAAASCLDGGGRLSGLVTDPSGGAMAGVAVQAIGAETGLQYNAVTSAEGFYVFPVLPAGHYELRIDQAGFKPYQRKNVDVTSNSAARADVVLVLGPRSEAITIEESPVAVDLSNTQTGERIGASKMADIPVNGRSYTDLLALQPGVIPVTSQQPNAVVMSGCTSAPPSGDLNSGNISVSGQRETTNGFSVNGSSAQEDFNMGAAVVPNLESIQEFQVLTGNFDAQYGNFSGGQVLVTTKSGTNQLHGSGFEFLRNTDLDARNYFASDRARYDRNQFGGSLGGPDNKRRRAETDPTRGTLLVLGRVVPFCGARFSVLRRDSSRRLDGWWHKCHHGTLKRAPQCSMAVAPTPISAGSRHRGTRSGCDAAPARNASPCADALPDSRPISETPAIAASRVHSGCRSLRSSTSRWTSGPRASCPRAAMAAASKRAR
jgi:hypothetical protein